MDADAIGKEPLFDLGMRLGEGSGATLAIGILSTSLCNLGTSVALVHRCTREPDTLATTIGAGLLLRAALVLPVYGATWLACRAAGYGQDVLWLLGPLFLASLALCSRCCCVGAKRRSKKSSRVGRSGISGSRGSSPIR